MHNLVSKTAHFNHYSKLNQQNARYPNAFGRNPSVLSRALFLMLPLSNKRRSDKDKPTKVASYLVPHSNNGRTAAAHSKGLLVFQAPSPTRPSPAEARNTHCLFEGEKNGVNVKYTFNFRGEMNHLLCFHLAERSDHGARHMARNLTLPMLIKLLPSLMTLTSASTADK